MADLSSRDESPTNSPPAPPLAGPSVPRSNLVGPGRTVPQLAVTVSSSSPRATGAGRISQRASTTSAERSELNEVAPKTSSRSSAGRSTPGRTHSGRLPAELLAHPFKPPPAPSLSTTVTSSSGVSDRVRRFEQQHPSDPCAAAQPRPRRVSGSAFHPKRSPRAQPLGTPPGGGGGGGSGSGGLQLFPKEGASSHFQSPATADGQASTTTDGEELQAELDAQRLESAGLRAKVAQLEEEARQVLCLPRALTLGGR